jgi:molybdopterin molybdotransferase
MKKMPMMTIPQVREILDSLKSTQTLEFKAERDLPPFNKVLMDGYACRAVDLSRSKERPLKLIAVVGAGIAKGSVLVGAGDCAQVMTGAILPEGADIVIKREDIVAHEGEQVIFPPMQAIQAMQLQEAPSYIMPKGAELKEHQKISFQIKKRLNVAQMGALASLGQSFKAKLKVSLFATGDEIVPPELPLAELQLGQIRNANNVIIKNLLQSYGADVLDLGIVKDDEGSIRTLIQEQFNSEKDIVIFSGGVSMGDFDFGPLVMRELGFTIHCDQVAIKPGKPFTLASRMIDNKRQFLIGLPGNPVSALATSMVLVSYLLGKDGVLSLPLALDMKKETHKACFDEKRTTFWPVRIVKGMVYPLDKSEYRGSGNITSLINADGFMEIPTDVCEFQAKENVHVRLF